MIPTLLTQGQQLFPEQTFPDQVTTNSLVQNVVYATGTVGAIFILVGIVLVDVGGVRRVNVLESALEKVIGFFIGFAAYFAIGFAIWNWQYYVAFEVPNPYWASIQDWWLGGSFANELAQHVDPGTMGAALNTQQIFIFFLACFAGIANVLIHLAVTERIKPAAYYIICLVAAIVSSVLSWLLWGSTGPITNLGFHDFFGAGFVYIFPGAMALVLVLRVGKRPGQFIAHPRLPEFREFNLGLTTTGVLIIFAGLPMVILSCGFFFAPEALYVSITMADTAIGVAFNNLGLAFAGGTLMGALIAYLTKKYIYVLFGALGGYLSGTAGFDIYAPWQMFLVALGAPIVAFLIYSLLQRRQIDEHKAIPLFLGCASYGVIMVGLIKSGTPRGGYFGIEEGPYAFQHGEVHILWQLLGLGVSIGTGLVTALILAFILERTIGLRVSDETMVEGYDRTYWGMVHDIEPRTPDGSAETAVQGPGATSGDGGVTHEAWREEERS